MFYNVSSNEIKKKNVLMFDVEVKKSSKSDVLKPKKGLYTAENKWNVWAELTVKIIRN